MDHYNLQPLVLRHGVVNDVIAVLVPYTLYLALLVASRLPILPHNPYFLVEESDKNKKNHYLVNHIIEL